MTPEQVVSQVRQAGTLLVSLCVETKVKEHPFRMLLLFLEIKVFMFTNSQ